MKDKNQLTMEEKELLIKKIKNGDETANKEFFDRFYPLICKVVKNPQIFIKNKNGKKGFLIINNDPEEAKTLAIEAIYKMLKRDIKKHAYKIIAMTKEDFVGWISKNARNYCIDCYRNKQKNIQIEDALSIIDDIDRDEKAKAPGSKEYYEEKTKKNISLELKKGLEISLGYVECLYQLKNGIGQNFKKYKPVLEIDETLKETKRKFNYILPRVTDEKISNFQPLVFKERPQPNGFLQHGFIEQEYRIWAHIKLNRLIYELIDEVMFFGATGYEAIQLITSPFFEPKSDPPICCGVPLIEFGIKLSEMKMSPPRLIYIVWSKAKEFKIGKKVDRIKIEDIYNRFKMQTKGTDKGFLFNSEIKLESLRQLSYRNSSDEKFYKAIVNFIYRKSFIEKEMPGILKY